jgi:hypothetical protein
MKTGDRIYKAIILLDEPGGRHFATWVELQKKTIETRMKLITYTGDIVICCSGGSMTRNKEKALCVVHIGQGRPMTKDDETAACIESMEGRYAYPLSNWRYFSRKFEFSKCKVAGTFQWLFDIRLPDNIEIIEPVNSQSL